MGWGSNQRSWLYHSGPLPPLRLEPNPFRFQPSSSPFFWKEKEKEKEGRGDEKEIFFDRSMDADRFRRGARILGINWSIFFFSFFFRAVEIRRDNRFLFSYDFAYFRLVPEKLFEWLTIDRRFERKRINFLLRISKILFYYSSHLHQNVP